ncbi:MAG: penicillin-binding protein 2 [Anaerolineae bacterium]|nr:penicillin-binding protein 2 [Anaerolineae bacterium]MCB0177151.1 penicillin-binding protein 2 [Anaerolineae bacterium]
MEQAKYRIYTIMAIMSAAGLVLIGQLVRWQVIEHHRFATWAEEEHQDEVVIPARRGEIRDRTGHLLATDLIEYDISASPKIIADPDGTADRLATLLDMPRNEIYQILTSKKAWMPLKNNVPQSIGETILGWDTVGLLAEPRSKRVYPEGDLGAHFLGFVNNNGNGFYGVEGYYDNMLNGSPGLQAGERSPFGDLIPLGVSRFVPPVSGPTLYLTIDRGVQYVAERELEDAVLRYGAQSGSVVVMQPKTGAILAMAGYPSYDPNNYGVSNEYLFSNPTVSEQYEPGSVFKIVTMAAGLDAGVVGHLGTIYDGGSIEVGGRVIYNWDRKSHGEVDMTDVLAKSLNVGVAQIAVALGKDRFYTYMKRFGFGQLTEIDLGNEGPGTLKTPKDANWHESDLGTNSFGQGIAVTPVQIAAAVSAVANDGLLMKPYIVQRIVDGDRQVEVQPTVIRQAVTAETAHKLTDMLVEALTRSESASLVPGYRVAGKTGTAEIPVPGGYHPTLTLASFAGYLPADDPELLILVIIDRPTSSRWGSETASPTFKRIAEQLAVLLNILPDDIRESAAIEGEAQLTLNNEP